MAYQIDITNFTNLQRKAVDKASEIALAYNSMIFYEIGREDFARLRAANDMTEMDLCDGNMILLAAMQVCLDISEDEALDLIVAPHPEIANLIFEMAKNDRNPTS